VRSSEGEESTVPDERIARIDLTRTAATRQCDAEKYAHLAVELGASAARVIPADIVVFDDRVTLKCAVPKCFGYGTCANCPPHSPSPEKMRSIAAQYDTAVALRLDVPPEVIVRDRETKEERVKAYASVFSIVSALESAAFYDGHYLSVALAAGSCKSTLCGDLECAVLSQRKCRHNLVSRPSMEAVGVDCFKLATALGWDIYPIGSAAAGAQVPGGALLGVLFVG
jgi:predicted metal-binding protein